VAHDGQCLTTDLAVSLGQKANNAQAWCQLELDVREREHEIKQATQKALIDNLNRTIQQERKIYADALRPKWYENPVIFVISGVVIFGVGVWVGK
jgi:preprotein translocase subunit Sss1